MAHAHAHAQAQAQAQLPQRFQQQLHPNNYPPPPPYYNLQFQLSPTKQSQQYFTLSESSMTTPSSNSPYPSSSGTPLSSHQKLELGSSDPSSSLKQQSLLFLSGDALAQKYYHNQLPMNCVASPGYVYYQSYCAVGVNRSRLTSFMDNCDWNVVEASDVVCHFCQQRGHISKYCHFRAQQSSPRG
ncbi:hypothetical protein PACTADRAFT_35109 [Pachysolen tannophilus NRRL Y-2460]|uniref:CCHC-type domain-containing protein n=1 Tax=Pachysolen tannophilus NRRL Y-2460 TaxID=669874 RepID=A0A1E4TRE9_PACTA|nr:hypothetical protein PACTADRAFT_35109 [Pachysolen tannophilus NRRL Y-2460]